jgi:uncharacterized surface protein with fasciclin (FAS1) repeats
MKRETIFKQGRRAALAACTLLIGASVLHSCKDEDHEVLTGQPEWLGNSIYERLQEEGKYTNVLRLIDDLGQTDVLRQTGSKTLFPADDDAFNEWFSTNQWGIRSYEQMSLARKKLMLKNAMIDNAYLIALMSNVSANPPEEGKAMRRLTSTSIYDSVYIMPVDKMPETSYWAKLRAAGKSVPVFHSTQAAPMIHFLPAFMKYNKITDNDLAILTNHQSNSVNDSWINGKKVIEADITCKNGYIHKVSGVVESSPSMAEILHQRPELSAWSRMVDRFSAPYISDASDLTVEYNRINGTNETCYLMKYFNRQDGVSINGQIAYPSPDGDAITNLLPFDPGKTTYMYTNTMGYDLHYDAGAMIVPTDEAVNYWWNNEGRDLKDEYKQLDSVPANTIATLLNVNMLPVFTEAVPSKFKNVLNDAKEELGITPEDVIACYMGCNGVIYVVNKVFAPAEFASVVYPALAHESQMNIIYWAIDKRDFKPYLLSMEAEYAFLLPTNNAMKNFVDPASYGLQESGMEAPVALEFEYNTSMKRPWAYRYTTTISADGTINKVALHTKQLELSGTGFNVINSVFDDMLDQFIIVLPSGGKGANNKKLESYIAEGYRYFKTKGGTLVYAEMGSNGKPAFAGGWQLEHQKKLIGSSDVYKKENGSSYQLEDQVPMGSQNTLFLMLQKHNEYANFLKLLQCDYSDLLKTKDGTLNAGSTDLGSQNFRLFDNYNYTVFVPSNDAITQLQNQKTLPSWRELQFTDSLLYGDEKYGILDSIIVAENWTQKDKNGNPVAINDKLRDSVKTAIRNVFTNFVRYHVQDRAVAIAMAPDPTMKSNYYESMLRNPATGRFYQLTTLFDTNTMTVTDVAGVTHNVVKTAGLYNNMCREYWFENKEEKARLVTANDAMVHLIDNGALMTTTTPKTWQQTVKEYLKR